MNTIARNIVEMIDQMTPEQKEIKSKYSLDCLDCW